MQPVEITPEEHDLIKAEMVVEADESGEIAVTVGRHEDHGRCILKRGALGCSVLTEEIGFLEMADAPSAAEARAFGLALGMRRG